MDTSMWTNGEESRYKIAAANEEGGRSLTIDRGIADELRQHKDYRAWNAFEPAHSHMHSQLWGLSNAGSDESVVLNDLIDKAMRYITTGQGNSRIGLFSWSAEQDADPTDPYALVQANPRVGYGASLEDLIAEGSDAVERGGESLTGFRTEKMCVRVRIDNPAIDPGSWRKCLDPGTLDSAKGRLAACVDVSPDGQHVTLVVAGVLPDGRTRVEAVAAWDSRHKARTELPPLVRKIRPRTLGWFPSGPAAALAADITRVERKANWPPAGTTVEAIRGDTVAACMGLEALVRDGQLAHSGDPLLDAHVAEAERMKRGDGWVFVRHGDGHVDGAYAMAGAAHLVRSMPGPVGKPRLVIATADED
jgi:phage terminase large subunit-like protein